MDSRRRIIVVIARLVVISLVAAAIVQSVADDTEFRVIVIADESAPPDAAARWAGTTVNRDADIVIHEGLPASELTNAVTSHLWQLSTDFRPAIVIESDGHWPASLAVVARRLSEAGSPLQWRRVNEPGAPRISGIAAPSSAGRGQEIAIVVDVDLASDAEAEIELLADGETSQRRVIARSGPVVFRELVTRAPSVTYTVRLHSIEDGKPIARAERSSVVNVRELPEIWVVSRAESTFAESLERGQWPVVRVRPQAFAGRLDGFDAADVLVLDNLSTEDLPDVAWGRIVDDVERRGLGLIVLGGPNAYGLGGYRNSVLESVLPLISEPPEDEVPASIMFLVDVSGSMDRDRGVGSRLSVARQAATETARLLRPTDKLGLIAFDVESRTVLPLESRPDHIGAIERSWPGGASGGTNLAPSFRTAAALLDEDSAETKMIILLTDGFLADYDLLAVSGIVEESDAALVALVIADEVDESFVAVAEIARISGGNAVLVEDILELPALMRQEAELQQAAAVIGPSEVRELRALPEFSRELPWPDVDAYALTRPVSGANVFLVSQRADPLIAARTAGTGRVISVTPGFSAWSRSWLTWQQWPDLAAAIARHAISGYRDDSRLLVESKTDGSRSLALDTADRKVDGPMEVLMHGEGDTARLLLDFEAPGRLSAVLDDRYAGKYSLFVPGLAASLRTDMFLNGNNPGYADIQTPAARWVGEGIIRQYDPEAFDVLARKPIAPWQLAAMALVVYVLVMVLERDIFGRLQFSRGRVRIRRLPFART